MRQGFACSETVELLGANRLPALVDDVCWVARHVARRELEMFGPEAQPRLRSQWGIGRDDIELRVVEERVVVEMGRADRQPRVVDDADLCVDVDRIRGGSGP